MENGRTRAKAKWPNKRFNFKVQQTTLRKRYLNQFSFFKFYGKVGVISYSLFYCLDFDFWWLNKRYQNAAHNEITWVLTLLRLCMRAHTFFSVLFSKRSLFRLGSHITHQTLGLVHWTVCSIVIVYLIESEIFLNENLNLKWACLNHVILIP